jgi:hypothetical protein
MRRHSKFFGIKLLNRFALITFLGCISLFSVGFSSWAFVKQTTMGEDVNVNVSDVVNLSDFIEYKPISMFDYCKYGIIKDETIVFDGEICFSFKIKINSGISNIYSLQNSINVFTYISCDTFDVINSTYLSSSPSVNYGVLNSDYPSSRDLNVIGTFSSQKLSAATTYNDVNLSTLEFLFFSFVYHFDFSSKKDTFETDIYNNLLSAKFNHEIGVSI